MAYNHRGAYGHTLSDVPGSGPAVTTNAQDRLSHVHALMQGCQAGFQQAGASTQLNVDLQKPKVRNPWLRAQAPSMIWGSLWCLSVSVPEACLLR